VIYAISVVIVLNATCTLHWKQALVKINVQSQNVFPVNPMIGIVLNVFKEKVLTIGLKHVKTLTLQTVEPTCSENAMNAGQATNLMSGELPAPKYVMFKTARSVKEAIPQCVQPANLVTK